MDFFSLSVQRIAVTSLEGAMNGMSDQTEHQPDADQLNPHHNESSSHEQITPTLATSPDPLTWKPLPKSEPPLLPRSIAFPLTREAPALRQILGMLLYSLFMALNITGCQLFAYLSLKNPNDTFFWVLVLVVDTWLFVLILPASTTLCGALFGSWRGTLVSFLAISGGLLLTRLLNSPFSGLQQYVNSANLDLLPYMIPGLLATLLVGFLYDRRTRVNGAASVFPMMLGVTITLCGIFGSPNLTVESGPFTCCLFLFLIPCSAFSMTGLEFVLRKLVDFQKQRQLPGKNVSRSNA